MEKLVSSWYKNKPLPESYIFPPETRPGNLTVPTCKTIPVIDLGKAEGRNRTRIVQQICKASEEYGFFQVVNHGVPEDLMKESMDVLKEFFEMPAEDKAVLYSEDPRNRCRLSTSSVNYAREKVHHWRDNLRHPCLPGLEDCIQLWPQKPIRYREVVARFSIEAKKLGSRILEFVAEGLGLEPGYFGGNQLQIISNDKLKSVEHRVVTNSNLARTSAAFFIAPSGDSIIEPAKSLIGQASLYRAFEFKDFLLHYFPNLENNDVVMERFRSQA
ncbi:hypothetical protein V6N13_045216 [Hibiscus sabdariffa]